MSNVLEIPQDKIQLGGTEYTITPVRMGKIQSFSRAVEPIVGDLLKVVDSGEVLPLISNHGDRVIEAVSVATGIDRDQLEAALPDEFIALVSAVVRINGDFFARRLLPRVKEEVEGLRDTLKALAG